MNIDIKEGVALRKRIFEIIEIGEDNDTLSKIYDFCMLLIIIVSIVPLWTHTENKLFSIIDIVTCICFVIDYILRWGTADYKLGRGTLSFLLYPFTVMAIIDLISILPSVTILKRGFKLFKIFRLFRTFKVFRIFKAFRYSKSIAMIANVFRKQRESLMVVCGFAVLYIIVSALVIFNAEPDTFTSMFEAIYWATISLTTVGYGDVYATSNIGKIITMISAVLGIAIVALPAGIIIAGYQEELEKMNKDTRD